jgi:oligopeptidase B
LRVRPIILETLFRTAPGRFDSLAVNRGSSASYADHPLTRKRFYDLRAEPRIRENRNIQGRPAMRTRFGVACWVVVVAIPFWGVAVGQTEKPKAPVAEIIPQQLEKHGHVRTDNYYWLKQRENPEVIAYLEAENAYTKSVMSHTEQFQEELFQEIVARIKEDDESVPYRKQDYYYQHRYVEGGEYPIYCRKAGSPSAPEEIILDVNELARGYDFFSARGLHVSPSQDILAYATDDVGRRFYTLRFRNLVTGEELPDAIRDVTANSAWANDNRTLFYTKQHPETLRWYRIYKHLLGTDPAQDELVYEEKDEEFSCWITKSKSQRYIILGSDQTLSSEYRFLDADDPDGAFKIFLPREPKHEYSIDHHEDRFFVRTNWQAKNFRLMQASIGATAKSDWTEVIPHRKDVFLAGIEVFRNHVVVSERVGGLLKLRIMSPDGGTSHDLDFGEPAYDAYPADNEEFDSNVLRYVYTSLTTPKSVFDYDMTTREKTLLKEEEVLGGFDKTNYRTERLSAKAHDGKHVPISIVYRADVPRDGSNPLLLYGYGSYGYSIDAAFRSYRLSLLDRGFVFAIAHVRGGQELGRAWYEDGRQMHKKNTFTDFIDCARYLVAEGWTSPANLFAQGGSAGGLLMGAVTNMEPDLFAGIVNHVPFVDVITTMLDDDIPLTTSEYDEWGDPNEKDAYEYILSYSPYDNIEAKEYPHILVTTGLHDSQVQYWEPAKYVAKMRVLKTGDKRLLLKTNMEAGHGGASGRFKRHRETALAYAFLLDLAKGHGGSARR